MKKIFYLSSIILLSSIVLYSCDLIVPKTAKWIDITELEEKKKKKMVVIELYTPWCGWCKRMEKNTFNTPKIAQYLNKNFYAVKFNAEDRTPVTFMDKTYRFDSRAGNRGRHELATMLMTKNAKQGYPTIAFLDADYNLIQAVPGYKNAEEFNAIMHYFSEEHYKTKKWDDFVKQFKENSLSPSE